jgi:hypothetical protein
LPLEKQIAVIEDDDDSNYALWRPLGSHTVHSIDHAQELEDEAGNVSWLIGKTTSLKVLGQVSPEQFEAAYRGQIVRTTRIASKVRDGPEERFVMRLRTESIAATTRR